MGFRRRTNDFCWCSTGWRMFLGLMIYLRFGITQRRWVHQFFLSSYWILMPLCAASNICSRTDSLRYLIAVGTTIFSLHISRPWTTYHQDSFDTNLHASTKLLPRRFTLGIDIDDAQALQWDVCICWWSGEKGCSGCLWMGIKGGVPLI
jgi:hypothetical protein